MSTSNQPRVLIIEENDALRVLLFAILRHQPVEVDTAASVAEGLQKVRGCDYALILIDLTTEGGDALEFLRTFQKERPEATSFVIAVRDPKSDDYIDPEVVAAVLNKPLEIDTLAEVVRECAQVVPPPEEPLPCPPAESNVRARMDRTPYYTN